MFTNAAFIWSKKLYYDEILLQFYYYIWFYAILSSCSLSAAGY